MPIICLAYIFLRLPARRDQLRNLFKTDGILSRYLAARERLPDRNKDETDEAYHSRLDAAFERIFAVELRQEYGLPLYTPSLVVGWISTSFVACYLTADVIGTSFLPQATMAISFALFGAFVWNIWNLISRYLVTNLSPSFLWWIPFRYIVAIAYGLFARMVFNEAFANIGAFFLSLVPISEAFTFLRSRLASF